MLTKEEMALLEKAYESEVRAALEKTPRPMQTQRKTIADRLAKEGFLAKCSENYGNGICTVQIDGYELTHAGRLAYCLSA